MNEKMKNMLTYFMGIIMLTMVIGALWQVFSRYVLNSPSTVTDELLRYMLIWATMIGSIIAFYNGEQMALTLLSEKLAKKPKAMAVVNIVIHLLIFALFAIFLLPGGVRLSASAMHQFSPVLQIPMGFVYLILPIMAFSISLIELFNITKMVKSLQHINATKENF